MELVILKQAQKELQNAPKDIIENLFALFEDLMDGKFLSMPTSRPLPSVAKGLHEIRLSGRAGEYRVFYVLKVGFAIYVLHGMAKKTQKIDQKTVDLIRSRLRRLEL
jgi:phage-related protein